MNLQKIKNSVTFDDLAGFDNYRQWIESILHAIKKADQLSPRGILLSGMPSTGKASCVLATAKLISRPVLRYHPDGRNAADVIAELGNVSVVFWIDEPDDSCIELLRQLSLNQKVREKVFMMATTTKPQSLPALLVHSAHFDRIFHIDLPNLQGRAFLWDKLIERVGGDPTHYDNVKLAQVSALFSAGEIEAVVRMSHLDDLPSEKGILADIVRRTPCAALADEDLAFMRHWARCTAESILRA